MQPSMFNVRVPLEAAVGRPGEVFLMNTFTDAQLVVTRDVADLLDRVGGLPPVGLEQLLNDEEREALETLAEQGFLVPMGGVAFIAGWLLLGLSAAIARRED